MQVTHITTDRKSPFGLAHALLVYSDGSRAFATLHDPVAQSAGGQALGPGRVVTSAFLKTLSKQLGESVSPDVLPETVLVRTSDVTLWWRPASIATLFYNSAKDEKNAKEIDALSGRRVPVPPLVFRSTARGLWVRALLENKRPTAATLLYTAPFFNVSTMGGVCLGTMRRPHGRGLETLPQWERAFFESEFTHVLPGVITHVLPGVIPAKVPATIGSFTQMWARLAKDLRGSKPNSSYQYFPTDWLAPAPKRQTLSMFVTQDNVGRL